MNEFNRNIQLRWADLDPNFHVRHSVYYDWGALCRIEFLTENGLTADMMAAMKFGPILFREECVFRKEIRQGDILKIDLTLMRSRKDFSRWTIRHRITKNNDMLAAVLTVDGAWMNTSERRLATPPGQVMEVFDKMPKGNEFEWE